LNACGLKFVTLLYSGLCHYVYPGAMHSRFEHSIGVYHVAGEVMDYLQRSQVSEISQMAVMLTICELVGKWSTLMQISSLPTGHVRDFCLFFRVIVGDISVNV